MQTSDNIGEPRDGSDPRQDLWDALEALHDKYFSSEPLTPADMNRLVDYTNIPGDMDFEDAED